MKAILNIENAKELKGKKINIFNSGYKGQDTTETLIVGDIVSAFDFAKTVSIPNCNNQQEYWLSYMTEQQLNEMKSKMYLLDINGKSTGCFCYPKYDKDFSMGDLDRCVSFEICE